VMLPQSANFPATSVQASEPLFLNASSIEAIGPFPGSDPLAIDTEAAPPADLNSQLLASLGPWSFTSSLVTGRQTPGVAAWGNYVYVLGGTNSSGALASVERATINPDGSLGTWSTIGTLPAARTGHRVVAAPGTKECGVRRH
jgi:hypothetical protein